MVGLPLAPAGAQGLWGRPGGTSRPEPFWWRARPGPHRDYSAPKRGCCPAPLLAARVREEDLECSSLGAAGKHTCPKELRDVRESELLVGKWGDEHGNRVSQIPARPGLRGPGVWGPGVWRQCSCLQGLPLLVCSEGFVVMSEKGLYCTRSSWAFVLGAQQLGTPSAEMQAAKGQF